jgi:hypothetical protein
MQDPHALGVHSPSPDEIEAVDPRFLREGLLAAQKKTRSLFPALKAILRTGMTEEEARRGILGIFKEQGVSKHWHRPYVRFGANTQKSYREDSDPSVLLAPGMPCFLDLGPVWPDPVTGLEYEGDFGDSFDFQQDSDAPGVQNASFDRCASACRSLFQEGCRAWKEQGLTGSELYAFLKTRASDLGYLLREDVDGHRIGDFPHHQFSKMDLGQTRFVPKASLWVLEVQIQDPRESFGAFYEDILD